MKYAFAAVLLLIAGPALAENAVKNGDFEKGKMGWDTDPGLRVVPIQEVMPELAGSGQGQVLAAELHKSNRRALSTRLRIDRKTRLLSIQLKMRAGPGFNPVPPTAPQFTIRLEYQGGATLFPRAIDPAGDWQVVKWDYTELQGKSQIKMVVEFHPGGGIILVDDVVVEEVQ